MQGPALGEGILVSNLVHGRKFCTKCRTLKPLSKFCLSKKGRFGVSSLCKECDNKKSKKYYEDNIEKMRECSRKYHKANTEKVRERKRKYHKANQFKMSILKLKNRSRKKAIPFDLDIEHLEQLWEICEGICPMTGVPMLKMSEKGRDQFVMSVDRIIPEKGYIKGNVRLVSLWYNVARSNNDDEFTLEMFQRTIDYARTIASTQGNASHKSQ